MARRMGTETRQSWALSHVHIAYLDHRLEEAYQRATTLEGRHEITCAGAANLMAYLGWLRSGELFQGDLEDLTLTPPNEGPNRGLPFGVGAVEFNLGLETKSDACRTADVIMAWESLSGLSMGRWLLRLTDFVPHIGNKLFSTRLKPTWTSRHFREQFAYPLLEQMQQEGEPTLKVFTFIQGKRIRDKVYSMHSWRRGGQSRVSRQARHNEPHPLGARVATPQEVYEHGRWRKKGRSEDMPSNYNQWDLADRLSISLFYM